VTTGTTTSTFAFDGIGTQWEVVTASPLGPRLRQRVLDRVERFDHAWSRFRDDSLVTRLAREGGAATFPEEAGSLFELYDRLHDATDGAVDPLVGRDLELLGYDAGYSLVPASRELAEQHRARGRRRWSVDVRRDDRTLSLAEPTVIDVGAAGKGLLVDLLTDLLLEEGADVTVVDGGGDLRVVGRCPVRVGLEHPWAPDRAVGVVTLSGGAALCASSTTHRAWGPGLHHVLDGRTGRPVRGVVATWVVAADAVTADGIATALFSTPPARLAHDFAFSSVLMRDDGILDTWGDLPGETFS